MSIRQRVQKMQDFKTPKKKPVTVQQQVALDFLSPRKAKGDDVKPTRVGSGISIRDRVKQLKAEEIEEAKPDGDVVTKEVFEKKEAVEKSIERIKREEKTTMEKETGDKESEDKESKDKESEDKESEDKEIEEKEIKTSVSDNNSLTKVVEKKKDSKVETPSKSTQTFPSKTSPSKTSPSNTSPSKVSSSVQTMKTFLKGEDIGVSNEITTDKLEKKPKKVEDDEKVNEVPVDKGAVDNNSKQIIGKIGIDKRKKKSPISPEKKSPPNSPTLPPPALSLRMMASDGSPIFPSSPSTQTSTASTPEHLSTTKWLDKNYPYLQRNSFSSKSDSGSEKDESNEEGMTEEVETPKLMHLHELNYIDSIDNEPADTDNIFQDLDSVSTVDKENKDDDIFNELSEEDDLFDGLLSENSAENEKSPTTSPESAVAESTSASNAKNSSSLNTTTHAAKKDINAYLMKQIEEKKAIERKSMEVEKKASTKVVPLNKVRMENSVVDFIFTSKNILQQPSLHHSISSQTRKPRSLSSPRGREADEDTFATLNAEQERLWDKWDKIDTKLQQEEKIRRDEEVRKGVGGEEMSERSSEPRDF